ncbi:MAG: transposase [Pseudomonadota bacterium]|nr:transposase [Pseudomonadota bacterium]
MTPGKPEAREYEYERHGTVALIANFEVTTGQVIAPTRSPTRTEEDFVAPIQETLETDPEAQWDFISDQLNTHQSEGLVRLIAKACGITDELGVS